MANLQWEKKLVKCMHETNCLIMKTWYHDIYIVTSVLLWLEISLGQIMLKQKCAKIHTTYIYQDSKFLDNF